MRIRSVRAHLLSYPLPDPLKITYHGGERTIVKRDAMLIRVDADNGLVGYGPAPGTEQAKNDIDDVIAPFLACRTLADPDALRVQFLEESNRDAELQKLYCAVEIALYDLIGKERGLPVSELLGGRVRDRMRLYGSAGMHMAPEKHAEEAGAISELGFRAYKMQSGIGPDQDLETVRRTRDVVGPDFDLIVDAHAWWQMGDRNYAQGTIDKLAQKMGEYNVAWLEEPLPPDEHAGYRRLKELDLSPARPAFFTSRTNLSFLDLILPGVDYYQLDVFSQGGYPTARRVLGEVSRVGLKFAFHSLGTALEVIAAAHLGVCWPDQVVEWLEYPCYSTPTRAGMYPFPLTADVLKEPLELEHGDLILSMRPGLGVDVDEAVVERYPWIPGSWCSVHTAHASGKPSDSARSRGANRQAS
uniref:glucarate dehydratase n=1 Tax=uncultured Acidobacteriota bacterium TaxID=171953 RepID=G8DPM0_9BACT|nr:mandelate racemase/muconate lactonizing protein [uncultured Acidobacteriota bacterium]